MGVGAGLYKLALCGLTSRKLPQGGLGISGLVHEEAHPRISYHN